MDAVTAITLLIALYGAILSTIVLFREMRSDRTQIKVLAECLLIADPEPSWQTGVKVINFGRRPVTIVATGLKLQRPDPNNVFIKDGALPVELTEGQSHTSLTGSHRFRLDEVLYAVARDATGREYRSTKWPIGPKDPQARKIIADVWANK